MEEIAGKGARGTVALFSSLAAGILNGWLGTGGGMVLILALSALYPGREREVLTLSTACVFAFSGLSILFYVLGGHMVGVEAVPILLPSLLGGAVGAIFLGRTSPAILDGILALLLILSGLRMLV